MDATAAARRAIETAIRDHDRAALIASRNHDPLAVRAHVAAARRLRRYGPAETTVVTRVR